MDAGTTSKLTFKAPGLQSAALRAAARSMAGQELTISGDVIVGTHTVSGVEVWHDDTVVLTLVSTTASKE